MSQITNTVLMIRPVQFRLNEQTSVNNYYQKDLGNTRPEAVNKMAVKEFDGMVKKLKKVGIQVIVVRILKSLIPRTPYFITIGFHFTLMEQ